MGVLVVTPPAPIVDLASAKVHCRVETDAEDAYISLLVSAATAWLDGPSGWLGRALGPQTLEARLTGFYPGDYCDLLQLPYGPLIDVASVKYDDSAGVEQTFPVESFTLDERGLLLSVGASWPPARYRASSVRIRYRAGYVEDPSADDLVENVPDTIKAAILLMVGSLYANREAVTPAGLSIPTVLPLGVESLLSPFKTWSV